MAPWLEDMSTTAPISVISADGTTLRLVRAGAGKPVVLVHGTMGSTGDWSEVMRRLSADFEVTAFDRRGRAGSGDGPEYSIDREIEDVLAVIGACRPPVHLVGHSFGAVLALLVAARARDRIDTLVLYEPPVGDGSAAQNDSLEEELDVLVADGDLDAAVRLFAGAVDVTDDEMQTNERREPVWAALRDGVRTAAREIRAAKSVMPFGGEVLDAVRVPTLVLLGADDDDSSNYGGVRTLADRLPLGRLERVPGHHLALVFAPDEFVRTIRPFLTP
jgi:pimeloyl-ACP methyl ester carboxylesterase